MIRQLVATAAAVATLSVGSALAAPAAHASAAPSISQIAADLGISVDEIAEVDTTIVDQVLVLLNGCTTSYVRAMLNNPHSPIPTVTYLPLGTLTVNYVGTLNYTLYAANATIAYVVLCLV